MPKASETWRTGGERQAIQIRIQNNQPVDDPEAGGHQSSYLAMAYTVLQKDASPDAMPTNSPPWQEGEEGYHFLD